MLQNTPKKYFKITKKLPKNMFYNIKIEKKGY